MKIIQQFTSYLHPQNRYQKILFFLLFSLLIIRVSLDYLGLFFVIPFPLLGELSLSQLFALGIIPLMAFFFFFHYKIALRTPLLLPFFLIIAVSLVTIPFTPFPNTLPAIYEALRVTSIIFIYILSFLLINTLTRFRILLNIILLASLIPFSFAFFQLISGVGYSDVVFTELRIFGSFTHPNIYGTYLLVILATSLMNYVLTKNKYLKLFSLGILFVTFLALTLTFTRVAWLMAIFIITLFIMVKNRLLIIPLFAVITIFYLSIPQIHQRVQEAFVFSPDNSLVWRLNLWHDTIAYTQSNKNSLLGNGTGTFMDLATDIRGDLFGDLEPHNEFVRAYVENGWLGLLTYIFYLLSILTVTVKKITSAPTIYGRNVFFIFSLLFIALTLASLTDHIFRSTPLQWTLMAILGGALATFPSRKPATA